MVGQWGVARGRAGQKGARICQGCRTRAQIYKADSVLRPHKVPLARSLSTRALHTDATRMYIRFTHVCTHMHTRGHMKGTLATAYSYECRLINTSFYRLANSIIQNFTMPGAASRLIRFGRELQILSGDLRRFSSPSALARRRQKCADANLRFHHTIKL